MVREEWRGIGAVRLVDTPHRQALLELLGRKKRRDARALHDPGQKRICPTSPTGPTKPRTFFCLKFGLRSRQQISLSVRCADRLVGWLLWRKRPGGLFARCRFPQGEQHLFFSAVVLQAASAPQTRQGEKRIVSQIFAAGDPEGAIFAENFMLRT